MGTLLPNGSDESFETIQRRATKLVISLHDNDYGIRLTELRLPSLNYRRQRGDVILLYQIFNSLVDINANDFLHSHQELPEDKLSSFFLFAVK